MFTFILQQMESSFILTQVNRVYKRAAGPLYLERNLNLTILLDEAHFEMLKRGQQNQAQDMFDKLTSLVINKTFHTVQGFYTINQSLHHLVVEGQVEDYDKKVRLQRNFTNMGAEFLARRLQMRYEELKPVYDLPEIEWLVIEK